MKGLLLKDLAMVKAQGRSMLIIVGIAIFLMISGENPTFAVTYAMMIFVMFGLTTISYDAFENGYAFLLTLPISRKLYVLEKYVFSLICILTGGTIGTIVLCVVTYIQTNQIISMDEVSFVAGFGLGGLIFLSLMLPIELKYGPEKGRIAMFAVFVIIMALVTVAKKVIAKESVAEMIAKISNMEGKMILLGLAIVTVIIVSISYMLSCKIMMKKEF